ncbi:MAG: hypothetical protein ACK4S4_15520 [Pyrinomonadaceae bacterium]
MSDFPKCKHLQTKVIDSRPRPDGTVYRRRECLRCSHRFNTSEEPSRRRLATVDTADRSYAAAGVDPAVASELSEPVWSVISTYRVLASGLDYMTAAAERDRIWAEGTDEGLVVVPDSVAARMKDGKKLY